MIHQQYCEQAPSSHEQTEETLLKQFDSYIVAYVKQFMRGKKTTSYLSIQDLEVDEHIQRTRIKFWRALKKKQILHPHSYIRHIVHSEFIDMLRQQKPVSALPTPEEWQHVETGSSWMQVTPDPAEEVEQQAELASLLNKTIQKVMQLPPRQRQAILCSLQERVDDLDQLNQLLKKYRIDIATCRWPEEKVEKTILHASLSAARHNLTKLMQEGRNQNH